MPQSQRVLLIGGSGFIGRHATAALVAAGHQVTVLARGRRAALEGTETLIADRDDSASLAQALEGRRFDLTVDFLVYSPADVERLLLIPYAALGRYVMISTGQVYLVTQDTRAPFREEAAEGPVIPEPEAETRDHDQWRYGIGKRGAERMLLGLRGTHGMRAVILRVPILQGEGDGTLRLWSYLERMLDGGALLLPDGGGQALRHLYAGDLARALVWLAEHEMPRMAAYNLAQPDVVTLRELLERVGRAAGVAVRFMEAPWKELREAGLEASFSPYAGPWCSVLDPARAAGEWGFVGTHLDDYLPQVVKWHLEHRPATSHPGHAQRSRELALMARIGVGSP